MATTSRDDLAMSRFGEMLREAREARPGLTQKLAADKLKLTEGNLSKWERGEIVPEVKRLRAIRKLYTELDEVALALAWAQARVTADLKMEVVVSLPVSPEAEAVANLDEGARGLPAAVSQWPQVERRQRTRRAIDSPPPT